MARPPGTPKTGGRKRGTPNKVTADVREWIASIIDNNRAQIKRDLKELEPKDRLLFLEKLMQYVIPKRQAAQLTLDKLTEADITEISNSLLDSIETDNDNEAQQE